MTGSQICSTRSSAAARAAISGPIPAGSPTVIATRGFIGDADASGVAAARAAAAGRTAAGAAARRVVAAAFAAASAVHDAFGVRQFVAQAALQPAAQARKFRRIQAEILLLRHFDRDRLERLEEGRAAQRPAARAVAAEHLRLVANTDLPHLDPGAELAGKLPDELAKIDAAICGEIKDQLRSVEGLLDTGQLHAEPAFAYLERRNP